MKLNFSLNKAYQPALAPESRELGQEHFCIPFTCWLISILNKHNFKVKVITDRSWILNLRLTNKGQLVFRHRITVASGCERTDVLSNQTARGRKRKILPRGVSAAMRSPHLGQCTRDNQGQWME